LEKRHVLLLVTWALLFGLFTWSIRSVLSPVVLFLALIYLLSPWFGTGLYRRLVLTLGIMTFLWLVHVAGSILAPFVLALVLAYVADPVVDRLQRQGLGRTWGALLVLLIAVLVIALGIVLLVPIVSAQGEQFLQDLPRMLSDFQVWYRAQVTRLAASESPILRDIPFERALEIDSEDVNAWLAENVFTLRPSWEAAIGVGRGVQLALTILGYVVLTPVLTFYLLRDFPSLQQWCRRALPPDRRDRWLSFLSEYDLLLGEYLRGQLLVALFVGLATGVGFSLVGFPNSVLLGVVAGVFNIVPYLGLIVSAIPALIIAIVTPPLWLSLLKVGGVFFVVQSLDAYVLSPKIVGERVGLHPVWVMLAIIGFGTFFGFTGLLIAIPLAVLIKLLIEQAARAYRDSAYYRTVEGDVVLESRPVEPDASEP
jgi:predicted PurR-regulated permease PerM